MKRILVLCDHGQVRSVAMAMYLRERGHFAVAGSYDNFTKADDDLIEGVDGYSMINLGYVFDDIIELNEGGLHFFGRDDWGDIYHPELKEKCMELMGELEL